MTRCLGMRVSLAMLLLPGLAHAGSDTITCETADRSIVMAAGSTPNVVRIKAADAATKKDADHEAPVLLQPHFNGQRDTDDAIVAVPIGPMKNLTKKHETMHVRHKKDGKTCDGRERTDDRWTQRYIFTAKHGDPLTATFRGKTVAAGLTSEGYLIGEMSCRHQLVSSPGGCHPEPGDDITWKPSKF